jgi:hypothetical protein
MKKRMGGLVASSAAVAILSLVSAGGGFSSAGATPPPKTPTPAGVVSQATQAGVATLVRTTTLGTGTATFGASQPLPSSIPPGDGPRTPNVGADASAVAKAPSSLSTSKGKGRPSHVPYPNVAAAAVSGATSGLVSMSGINAFDQGATHLQGGGLPGVDVEPSDQGLCASSSDTVEINNMVISVYSGSSPTPVTTAPLENLFGTPEVFGAANDGTYSVQGDPRCFYDSSTSRWYASQLWLDLNNATPQGWAGTWLAVSQTSDPTGSWNVYFIPDLSNATGTSTCNNDAASDPSANPCYGDQPLLGVDANSVQISTNEYSLYGSSPAGQDNYYFLSKSAVDSGAPSVPIWWDAIGATVSTPGVGPWYSVVPAQSPNGIYSTDFGGTSYGLSALDFTNAGDNRIAEWAFTNTSAVDGSGSINIYEVTLDSGQYGFPPLAAQKPGPTPLGDYWNAVNGVKNRKPQPEGPVQTNDDRMTTAAFDASTGAIVGALNTGVNQASRGSTRTYTGVAYFVVTPTLSDTGLAPSAVTTGYISPSGANAFFPAVAIAPDGSGVIDYALSGTGYYPSTAYSLVSAGDAVDATVHVAAPGAGPQDGFSEYQGLGTSSFDPRWGDYSGAQVVGDSVVFASEMINQSCTDAQFAADFTCGGTRDLFINWGTSVNFLTP